MFCRELFGKKPQKLEFGLQPHKIPDCDVVRTEKSVAIFFLNLDFFFKVERVLKSSVIFDETLENIKRKCRTKDTTVMK